MFYLVSQDRRGQEDFHLSQKSSPDRGIHSSSWCRRRRIVFRRRYWARRRYTARRRYYTARRRYWARRRYYARRRHW